MHASSIENMYRCYEGYARDRFPSGRGATVVLDVGGSDVNGSYREVFSDPRFRYVTADIDPSADVDIVLEDPYRIPLESDSVDIVLSGQMLEHCEYFWLTFAEMVRVLKRDGVLFLIAPSAGPIHRYPVDCYRFYPDSYRALARLAKCDLVDLWLDERGPWRDLVGIFSKGNLPARATASHPAATPQVIDPRTIPTGSDEEEATRGAVPYREVLRRIHEELEPALYLEIGVRFGHSLRLARCSAIGIDPLPELEGDLPPNSIIHRTTSDDFFAATGGQALPQSPDFAFIDGMHAFEFALRDFMHVERIAKPSTLVAIDDIYPCHASQAERSRRTRVWTGDVWRLHRALEATRPDLVLLPLDTNPTGMLLVAGLDPANRVLWDQYNTIVRTFRETPGPPPEVLARHGALAPDSTALSRLLAVLRSTRSAATETVRERLRGLHREEGNTG